VLPQKGDLRVSGLLRLLHHATVLQIDGDRAFR
jgi:hypothetical protein